MADLTGGQLVARTLKQAGVGHVFTLCGGHILPIYDGCLTEDIGVIDVRHEQAAAHAADAYARLTRNIGVAIVTAGPGVTDAVTGVANAYAARSPCCSIGGAAPLGLRGLGALQEMEQVALLRPDHQGLVVGGGDAPDPRGADHRHPHGALGTAGPGVRRDPRRSAHDHDRGSARAHPHGLRAPRRRPAAIRTRSQRLARAPGRAPSGPWSWRAAACTGTTRPWTLAAFAEALGHPGVHERRRARLPARRSPARVRPGARLRAGPGRRRARARRAARLPPRLRPAADVRRGRARVHGGLRPAGAGPQPTAGAGHRRPHRPRARPARRRAARGAGARFDGLAGARRARRSRRRASGSTPSGSPTTCRSRTTAGRAEIARAVTPRHDRRRRRRRRRRLRREDRAAAPARAVAGPRPLRLPRRRARRSPSPPSSCVPTERVLLIAGDGAFGLNGMEIETAVRFGLPMTVHHRQRRRLGPDPQSAAVVLRRGARGRHLAADHALRPDGRGAGRPRRARDRARARSARRSSARSPPTRSGASTWCSTPRRTGGPARSRWPFDAREDHVSAPARPHRRRRARDPHLRRSARGPRARGHAWSCRRGGRARLGGAIAAPARARTGCPGFRGARRVGRSLGAPRRCRTATRSSRRPGSPPPPWPTRRRAAGRKFYLVQHYESLYHGEADAGGRDVPAAAQEDRDLHVARATSCGSASPATRRSWSRRSIRALFHAVPRRGRRRRGRAC